MHWSPTSERQHRSNVMGNKKERGRTNKTDNAFPQERWEIATVCMTKRYGLWVNCGGDKKNQAFRQCFRYTQEYDTSGSRSMKTWDEVDWHWIRLTPISTTWACRVENVDSNRVRLCVCSWLCLWDRAIHLKQVSEPLNERHQPEQKMLAGSRTQPLENTWWKYRWWKRKTE